MLLEQLIAQVEKNNLMDDEELRDQIYTIFTAVINILYVTSYSQIDYPKIVSTVPRPKSS